MLRPDIFSAEKAQQLFEVLRIAARENNPQPFADNLKAIPTLSFRQLTDLGDIILERGDREHLLLFLFEAGINFNEVPDILEKLAAQANHWDQAPTKAALTLMALGVMWSADAYPGAVSADNELFNSHSSSSHVYPLLRYETKDNAVAMLRKKMHAFFLSQDRLSDTWSFIHDLFICASENGLSQCVNALITFKWPALIYVSDNKAYDEPLSNITSLSDPKLLEAAPKKPKVALAPKPTVATASAAATPSEFVPLHKLNTAPLIIPFIPDNAPPATAKTEPQTYPPAKPKFFIKNGARVIARPFMPYIDVNYRNHKAATAYTLAKDNKHEAVLKVLKQRSELVRDDYPYSVTDSKVSESQKLADALVIKVLSAVKINRITLFVKTMGEAEAVGFNLLDIVHRCRYKITDRKERYKKAPLFAVRIDKELAVLNQWFADYQQAKNGLKPANKLK